MVKQRKRRRIVFDAIVVGIIAFAVVLAFVFVKKPVERTVQWENPNVISSTLLINSAKSYNGKTIDFVGEAVGERLVRRSLNGKKGAWLHLNDDPYMNRSLKGGGTLSGYNSGMPVWVEDASLTDQIKNYGRYKSNGDNVKVVGVFNATCSEHGGIMDIHAKSVQVVGAGLPIIMVVPRWKIVVSVVLLVLAAFMGLLWRLRTDRARRGFFGRNSER